MRLLLLSSLPLFLICGEAHGQQSHGYAFLAPGGVSSSGHTSSTYQMGGGLEGILARGIGAGAELSALGAGRAFSNSVFGLFSLNGYYHFPPHQQKLDPFATLGYSLAFRTSTKNLFNFGFGSNYWFHDNLGLKLEFRDHVWRQDSFTANYWGFRVGLTFRYQ